jgi:polygalacturonase
VYFPAGRYLTGSLELRSNVTLWLEAGAVILGSTDPDDYPDVRTRQEGVECWGYMPLIRATGAKNVAIRGRGTIDGQGEHWWKRGFWFRDDPAAGAQLNEREKRFRELNRDAGGRFFVRPSLVEFHGCENVLLEGVTLLNSPMWTVHPVYCDNVTIDGITVINPASSKNTDGIDPDSCRNVRIANCHISVGDDCIAIKSGRDADGRRVGRPAENITITNCTMLSGHGGVVIGSEMSGGVRNVTVSNCVFDGTKRGIRIKAPRGRGGVVENVVFNGITMRDVGEAAIIVDMLYGTKLPEPAQPDETTPRVRGIRIANVSVTGAREVFRIDGLPESPVLDVHLSGVDVTAERGGHVRHVRGLRVDGSRLTGFDLASLVLEDVPEAEAAGVRRAAGVKDWTPARP